jgi:hypothetical protein
MRQMGYICVDAAHNGPMTITLIDDSNDIALRGARW